ncbi:hypothetical protein A2333_02945 [Candidatus Wolfebacteria bacterium RIFOXYB2_FULL_49_7]|uniref:Uncharacterized protein n=1 Tax=Candidatus Wolfebacteria bacterium RIFOXYB1_FULL_54_12 TaxID=1802559 RepID=A0A1F8DXS3_9BACT|nr:MAG: hypothetical protein A2372_03080 [Candidatus Wolfebacteria bacterium RIFOXYB1_FULL_54_12]OGM96719.1 MAG: hypothetical protein A2333_02945 [Candidatus Wolfebacteria bacterium RIFOXYB2_FULL_49_7]
MKTINGLLFGAMFLISVLAGFAEASEEVNSDADWHILPALVAPVEFFQEESSIVREAVTSTWVFGLPMVREIRTVTTTTPVQNGERLTPKIVKGKPVREVSWAMTIAMAAVFVGLASVKRKSQRNGTGAVELFSSHVAIVEAIVGLVMASIFPNVFAAAICISITAIICFSSVFFEPLGRNIVFIGTVTTAMPFIYSGQGGSYLLFVTAAIVCIHVIAGMFKKIRLRGLFAWA